MFAALFAQAADEFRNNLDMWNLIVGAAMPFVVAFFAQTGFRRGVNAVIGVILCLGAGAVTTWLQHGFHMDEHMVEGMLATLISAGVLLETFWLPTGWYPTLKAATSLNHSEHH